MIRDSRPALQLATRIRPSRCIMQPQLPLWKNLKHQTNRGQYEEMTAISRPDDHLGIVLRCYSQGRSSEPGSFWPPNLVAVSRPESVHFLISAWPSANDNPPALL